MKKCDLLIKDSTALLRYDRLEEHVDIAVSDGRILETGKDLDERYESAETVAGKGKLFMPGLVDSHMHTGQQLLKGLVLDAKPIIWTRIMLPFESTLTPDKMRLSAQAAALEMIKCGTAGFIDAGSYYMEDAAAVYEASGLRGALSYSTMDEEGLPKSIAMDAREAVRHTDSLYDGFHGKGNLKVYYSLRALNSCSSRLVSLAANLVVGAFVGLTGVAGFLLPIVYTGPLGMGVTEGLALSFAAFLVSGALGSVNYSRAGNLDIPFGIRLSLGSLAGSILGVKLNLIIPESTVKILLYLVVLLSGISILLRRDKTGNDGKRGYVIRSIWRPPLCSTGLESCLAAGTR